jgi:hypothetical protein
MTGIRKFAYVKVDRLETEVRSETDANGCS